MKLPRFALPVTAPLSPSEFDPTLARLIASPPQPLPKLVLRIALSLVAAAIAWSAIGRLDIVAVAQGRLVPQTYVKIVQPTEAGVVREILVREGETVSAGQVLMRMDPTLSAADLATLRREHERKRLALRRIDAELAERPFAQETGDEARVFAEIQAQYTANRNALAAAIAQERAGHERSRQEMQAAEQTRDKLAQTLPLYREQEAAFRKLTADGYTGKLMANDKLRERIEKEQDLKTQEHVIARERANMVQSEKKVAQIKSDAIRQLRNEHADAADRFEKLAQDLAKQDHRHGLLELKAPQSGRVKDLATHTAGTVTQPGTILMTLVPDDEILRAEVWLSNEDVGFVRPGQEVKLKFAAFQFQKYGMLDGTVEQIAADAAEKVDADPKLPQMAYRTLIALHRQTLAVAGVPYRLAPGMQLSAEVKLGERTILEYLLSPVRKAWHEAGREK
ncbi:MAG: HlyD family type I secretion periplasmic adaptor subunit [Sulfuritalea sp.]|nr:HlyD family type I secretion periplasmic adaptor subunit [Sulfuritalea sp.]